MRASTAQDASVIWHDLECGAYTADLDLWKELAAAANRSPVLDLGCGTGRVALSLAEAGHRVTALDRDQRLIEELGRRATGLPVATLVGNAAEFELGDCPGFVAAPMQLMQLLKGEDERRRCLRCVRRHLPDGGLFAAAIVDGLPAPLSGEAWTPPLPDAREIDGWVYSSLPLETVVQDEALVVRRLRQIVSPDGELAEELNEIELALLGAEGLEAEAGAVGLRPAGRREISATDVHVGSTVVLLKKGA